MKPLRQLNWQAQLRLISIILMTLSLTACVYWLRAYQTYLQFDDFDRYFSTTVNDNYTLHFKEPILYSQDFIALAKLYPSEDNPTENGRRWRYWFRKVDDSNTIIKPEIKFHCDLDFNKENRLTDWSFSSLFLQIAPPEFLTVSLRSIGGAKIDKEKQQLRADTTKLTKINSPLPKKTAVIAKLGQPLSIKEENDTQIYVYHFLLETYRIEQGYEDRALNEIQLSFDNKTQELIKMSGRFAGLKISIDYRNFVEQ
ncbi:MAG: hypothetical protein WAX77_11500 [Methylococcaceae bacterium]